MGKSTSDRELSELLEAKWMDRLEDLLEYRQKYGDCNVPFQFRDNQRLANWVLKQRKFFRRGELPAHRIDQLNAIGFEWTSYRRVTWEQRFEQLRAYQQSQGTTLVTEDHGDPQIVALAQWVKKQRTTQRKREMGPERMAMLDAIGFVWDVEDSSWEARFYQLREFMRVHGQQANPKEPGLKGWVYRQRSKFHEGILPEDKIKKLTAIGFNWGYVGRENKGKSKQAIKEAKGSVNRHPSSVSVPREPKELQSLQEANPLSSLVDACMMVSTTPNKPARPLAPQTVRGWSNSMPLSQPRYAHAVPTAVAMPPSVQVVPPHTDVREQAPQRVEDDDDGGETDTSSLNGRVVSVEGLMPDYSERSAASSAMYISGCGVAPAATRATTSFLHPWLPQHSSA